LAGLVLRAVTESSPGDSGVVPSIAPSFVPASPRSLSATIA